MIHAEHRQSLAQLERDAALERVSRTRRWVIIGAGALTAGFAALVSAAVPGRTLGKGSRARSVAASAPRSSAGASLTMPPLASAADLGLQGPEQAPQSAPAPSSQQLAPSDPSQAGSPAPAPSAPVSGGS